MTGISMFPASRYEVATFKIQINPIRNLYIIILNIIILHNFECPWRRICSNCRYHNDVFFPSYMTCRIRLITGFVLIWANRRVSHVEQDKLTLPDHLKYQPVFGGARVAESLTFYVLFCTLLFVFCRLLVIFVITFILICNGLSFNQFAWKYMVHMP